METTLCLRAMYTCTREPNICLTSAIHTSLQSSNASLWGVDVSGAHVKFLYRAARAQNFVLSRLMGSRSMLTMCKGMNSMSMSWFSSLLVLVLRGYMPFTRASRDWITRGTVSARR